MSITRGKQAISSYELTSVGVSSCETKKLWADILENEYRYDFSTPDGVSTNKTLSKFEVDEIFAKGYETAGIDTMNIILAFLQQNIM